MALPFRGMYPRQGIFQSAQDRGQIVHLYRSVFPLYFPITDTDILQKPVDYYMEGLPQYRELGRTFEKMKGTAGNKVAVADGGGGRLSKNASTFTVKSDKRGYE